jgi:hypothetical protein
MVLLKKPRRTRMSADLNVLETWTKRIEEHKSSGLPATAWCRAKNYSYKSFINWRIRIDRRNSSAPKKPLRASSFSELTDSILEKTGAEILVRDITIKLPKGLDETTLKSCLQTLLRI